MQLVLINNPRTCSVYDSLLFLFRPGSFGNVTFLMWEMHENRESAEKQGTPGSANTLKGFFLRYFPQD